MTEALVTPVDLGPRGLDFWRSTVDEFDLSATEAELLTEVCRLLDECEELRQAIGRDGVTVLGSTGQVRANPCLTELRQHRLAVGRLIAQLAIPDASDKVLRTPRQARAHQGAQARWAGHLKQSESMMKRIGAQ
jgi:hypothetical protein